VSPLWGSGLCRKSSFYNCVSPSDLLTENKKILIELN
jgi:hypothetical protein